MGILKYTVNSKQPERRNMQLLANFQKGELEKISVFIGGFWERGHDLFQGWLQFLHKKENKIWNI